MEKVRIRMFLVGPERPAIFIASKPGRWGEGDKDGVVVKVF